MLNKILLRFVLRRFTRITLDYQIHIQYQTILFIADLKIIGTKHSVLVHPYQFILSLQRRQCQLLLYYFFFII